jgi:hypothetical protein
MITKGLKVGDTFEDGGMIYKVTKVVGDRYESAWTGEISSKALLIEQPKQEVKEETNEDLSSVPYAQLKKMCADKGLDAKGSKEELIARLEG